MRSQEERSSGPRRYGKVIYFTEWEKDALDIVASARRISANELIRECLESRGVFSKSLVEEIKGIEEAQV